ncbi:putative RNA dependent RNA polymerase [Rosellinia necatrix victorivirus 1]|uniref:RNA-directed RNA polymerase n=2 Tax=Rosellinia necatrix victorivirus 1 TaxID=1148491 RepID=A0A060N758_9VIRU|nr:putative RNA dependent RNA polymerase [Rosellinia necatrix victorivirus 1]BAN51775.1 putative RNA dependent RNA polymerase [Rosellinia necatrix victorivirus 1]
MAALDVRAAEFGLLGSHLAMLIRGVPGLSRSYDDLDFTRQLIRLQSDTSALARDHPLLPCAVSLLLADFPVQLAADDRLTHALVNSAYSSPAYSLFPPEIKFRIPGIKHSSTGNARSYARAALNMFIHNADLTEAAFPRKAHSAANDKPLLHLRGLLQGLRTTQGTGAAALMVARAAGRLTEDQVISLILYRTALAPLFGQRSYDYAWWAITEPGNTAGLSNALKALGLNATACGAALVEAKALQGRGIAPVDMAGEVAFRVQPDLVKAKVLEPDYDELREHIKHVLHSELAGELELTPLAEFWSSRWLWCVNGSNTSTSDRAMGLDPHEYADTHTRTYRRMVAETLEQEPISTWDGTTSVSASVKLETAKSRAIFACDTRSYFAFSWILNDVQKRWGNNRVLLDPGKGGMAGIDRRIRRSQHTGGVNVMLDYDDFNSHHSTRSMQILFEELCDMYSAPSWYRDTLVNSFERMFINFEGKQHHVLGTLMSGHRGTTFINSVLNAVYIRAAIGGPTFDSLVSLHTGDDVYLRAPTLSDCSRILTAAKDYGCRMNPTKQSIGFRRAEFLRMGIGERASYGYLARSVAALACGNWFNPNPMTPWEGFNSLVTSARSIINRAGGQLRLGELLSPAVRHGKSISYRTRAQLIDGECAIEGAPVYGSDFRLKTFEVKLPKADAVPISPRWRTNATRDYLLDHVSPIEAEALSLAGADITTMMVVASFGKGLDRKVLQSTPDFVLRRKPVRAALGFTDVVTLLTSIPRVGCLSGYPLLNLVAGRLSNDELRHLVLLAGGDANAADLQVEAFGAESLTRNIIGTLPFSDAVNLGKRTNSANVYVLTSIYM